MNAVDACKGVGWVKREDFVFKASQVRFYIYIDELLGVKKKTRRVFCIFY